MLKFNISIVCIVLFCTNSFSQNLVYGRIPTEQRIYNYAGGVERADDFISINWNKENYKYSIYGYDDMPYVFITSQHDYESLKTTNSAAYINFNKYVLFSGLFYINPCNLMPGLGLWERGKNYYYLYFWINNKHDNLSADCQERITPLTFLIPYEYLKLTNYKVYFSEYH
ncbi:MAG: hypothetical protein LBV75_03645 [Paludibacter sp.]|jgi:hypothetical protein|nr:hypothetical protein [Paludibacter sp.]